MHVHTRARCRLSNAWPSAAACSLRVRALPNAATAQRVQRPADGADPWERAEDMLLSGTVADGVITSVNRGGVLVQLNGLLRGFMPFTKLDPVRLRRGHQGDLRYLVGQQVRARVVQVDRTGRRRELVLSERAARAADAVATLKLGDVVRGRVERLEDYGALVALLGADGAPSGATGLLHKSELSWELVLTPDAVLAVGQELDLQVASVDAPRSRVGLSLRALTRDPLMETLESIAWQAEAADNDAPDMPPELQPVVAALAATPGISGVVLGRRAVEARTVAQDVELYLTRGGERPDGGFTLMARSGRTLVELLVDTQLSRDEVKAVCRRVLTTKS